MRSYAAVVVLGVAGLLVGCGDDDSVQTEPDPAESTAPAPGEQGLDGRTFVADHLVVDGAEEPAAAGSSYVIGFADGSVTANAGCNHLGGTYRLDGDQLMVDGVSMTEMACDEALMTQDELVVELLQSSPTVTLDGDHLVLAFDRITFEGLDREVADPDRPLVGTIWSYDGLLDADTASRGPLEATVTFADDGTLSVDACRTATGTYTLEGDQVTITLAAPTGEPCADPNPAEEEDAFLAHLAGTHSVTIDAATAQLVRDDGKGVTLREVGAAATTPIPDTTLPTDDLMSQLDGRTFVAPTVTIDGAHRAGSGDWISVSFDGRGLSVFGGCNSIGMNIGPAGAGYDIKDGSLIVSEVMQTAMLCNDELMEFDRRLTGLLTDSPSITLDGDRLVLGSATVVFDGLDQEVADPDRPLVGTAWAYAQLLFGPAMGAYAGTFVLAADGTVSLTGCQTITGTYQLDGDRLSTTLDAPTGEPCTDELTAMAEREVFSQIAGTFTVSITADQMSIARDDNKGVQFNAA